MFPNSAYNHPAGTFAVPNTPPGVDPLADPTTTVSVNCEWLPLIRGALTQLLLQSTWNVTGDDLGVVQSQVWRLINLFAGCEMCDCLVFDGGEWKKRVPDGHGGTTLETVDPRTEGDVPPPWPSPPAGQTGNCLSAANIANVFQQTQYAANDILTSTAVGFLALQTFVAMFSIAFTPIGAIVEIAITMAGLAVDAGATVWSDLFTGSTGDSLYAEVKCALACHTASDGVIDATGISNAKADFHTWAASALTSPQAILADAIFDEFCDGYGPNGLNLIATRGAVSSADCSECDCGEWTRYLLGGHDQAGRLITVGAGFSYNSGADRVESVDCSPDWCFAFDVNLAGKHVTHIEMGYDALRLGGVGGNTPLSFQFDSDSTYRQRFVQSLPGHDTGTITWDGSEDVTLLHVDGGQFGNGGAYCYCTLIKIVGTGPAPW
jgi:hypothetical protein